MIKDVKIVIAYGAIVERSDGSIVGSRSNMDPIENEGLAYYSDNHAPYGPLRYLALRHRDRRSIAFVYILFWRPLRPTSPRRTLSAGIYPSTASLRCEVHRSSQRQTVIRPGPGDRPDVLYLLPVRAPAGQAAEIEPAGDAGGLGGRFPRDAGK